MSDKFNVGACLKVSGIVLMCAILVVSSLAMISFSATEGASVSKFVGNKEGYNLTFNTHGIDASPVFSVENKVPLTDATMQISTADKGDGSYPLIPTVDVGVDDDLEWKFGGDGYGQFGKQTTFTTNFTSATSQFTSSGGTLTTASMKMPKEATVTSASMDVRGRFVPTGINKYDISSAGLRYPYESHAGNIDNTNGPDVAAVSYDYSNGKVLWFKCPSPATSTWTPNTIDTGVCYPGDIRVGDIVDNNGGGDIVVASSYYYGAVYWYHNVNNNGGTWTKYTLATNLYYPTTVRIADVDQDLDNDIVVLCYYYYSYFSTSSPMVMWYENDGSPTSGAWPMHPIFVPTTYNDGYAWAMDVGNFNGDAYPDVAWVGQWNYNFRWAKNPTSGYTNTWAYYAVNSSSNYVYYPNKIFASNIDASGYDDIAVVCTYSYGAYWYQNPGTTATWTRYTIDSNLIYGYDLTVAQFDGSNGVDVVAVTNGGTSNMYINLYKAPSPATGTWTKTTISSTYNSPYTCCNANFDAATGEDIFVASYNTGGAHWLANNGAGTSWTFNEINPTSMTDPYSAEPGDFDKDGDQDLVVCGLSSSDIRWFENDGSPSVGSWPSHTVDAAGSGPANCRVADMNGDGDVDVVATHEYGSYVAYYDNNGAGVFTKYTIGTGLTYVFGLSIGDIDKDGHLDVAVGQNYWSSAGLYWYEAPDNPKANNWASHTIATGLTYISNIELGDIDKDGDLDLAMITYTWSGGVVNWYECPSNPAASSAWTSTTAQSGIQYGYDLHMADINWDGYLDIVYTVMYYDVCWLKNPVTNPKNGGSWTKFTIVSFSGPWHYPHGLCVKDIGGDGYMDVVFSTYYSNYVYWYECPDDPMKEAWIQHTVDTSLNYAEHPTVADFDKDGVEDIASTGTGMDEIKWYKIATQYCKDPKLDIGGDAVNEWQITGECKGVYHFVFTSAMNNLLGASSSMPDAFGNNIVTSPIKLTVGASAGKMTIFNMTVIYDYTATIDKNTHCASLTKEIQDILDHDTSNAASVKIHVAVETQGPGKVYLHGLNITYNSHPDLDKNIPTVTISEDSNNLAVLDLATYFSDDYDAPSALNYEILMDSADASKVQLTLDGTNVNAKTLVPNWNGQVEATIKVTDNGDGAGCPTTLIYSNTFQVTVLPQNDEPTVGPVQIPSVTMNEGSTYASAALDSALYFLDIENNPLFFEAKVDPDGKYSGEDISVGMDSSKRMVITANGNFVGKDVPVRIFCDDDNSLEYDQNPYQDIKVTVLNLPDDAPYWDPIPKFEVPEDCEQAATLDLKTYVHDIDTNLSKIEFSIVSNVNSTFLMASIGSDDIVYVTSAQPNFDGRTTLILRAFDGDNKGDTTMDIVVIPENDAPTVRITNIEANAKYYSGDVVGIIGSANDPETLQGVEVSIQKTGSATDWKTAYGSLSWKYDWTADTISEPTEYTILARSYDGELYSDIASATFTLIPGEGPGATDTDGDGVPDEKDAFPDNPYEWKDTDGDKVGDNADAFPTDPKETKDTDKDGIGDKSDPYPYGEDGFKGNKTGGQDSDEKGSSLLMNLWWVVLILVLVEVVLIALLLVRKYQSKHPKSKSKAMRKKKAEAKPPA